jgi:hypothetical protein
MMVKMGGKKVINIFFAVFLQSTASASNLNSLFIYGSQFSFIIHKAQEGSNGIEIRLYATQILLTLNTLKIRESDIIKHKKMLLSLVLFVPFTRCFDNDL